MDLKQIQEAELQLLQEFAACCDKHQLRYYLAGGTLLGAVRHKGFIPWMECLRMTVNLTGI